MNSHRPGTEQRGIALILVLVFLVVLTLLGTTALRTAKIQEQLAGTTYDRLMARAASDAAIADAGDFPLLPGCGPAQYNTIYGNESADGWTVASWRQNNTDWAANGANKAIAFGSGGLLVNNPPRLGFSTTPALNHPVAANPTYIVDSFSSGLSSVPGTRVWRVTARGVGGRATTEVYSEAMIVVSGC